MNKILMDEDKIFINDINNDIQINGNVTLIINNPLNDINLNIKLNDKANLLILDFNLSGFKRNIEILQCNDTTINYIHSFEAKEEYHFNYVANIDGNNNKNDIKVYGVNKKTSYLELDGIIKESVKNNELNENVKILNLGDEVYVSPMMHVNVLDVIANHSTIITDLNKDELFYLESKGIEPEMASSLIEDAYLYGTFNNYPEFLKIIKGGVLEDEFI